MARAGWRRWCRGAGREIVRHGRNGLLVPPRSPAAIADAIDRLAGDPDLRRRMGQDGRERVEREFAEEHVVAQTLDVYRALLGTGEKAAGCR